MYGFKGYNINFDSKLVEGKRKFCFKIWKEGKVAILSDYEHRSKDVALASAMKTITNI